MRKLVNLFLGEKRHRANGRTRTRALEAAAPGRRWAGAPVVSSSLTQDAIAGGKTVSARAAHAVRNNAHAAAAVQSLVANIIGPGIKPSSQHPDPATRETIHRLWAEWTDSADLDGLGDFYAVQALAVRQMVEAGEAFCHLTVDPDAAGVPLRLRLIHADQVPRDWPGTMPGTNVRAGVELDPMGRVSAFHVLPARPDDPLMPWGADSVRIPADAMAHLFQPQEPGQLRGLSWFAPVLLKLHDLDQHSDAALMRAKVAALLCGVIIDPEGAAAGLTGTKVGDTLTSGLEPGTLIRLPPGNSIEFLDPKESQHFDAFTKAHLRAIAAGLGIPYEFLTGDLETVNYSSTRAGMVEFRRKLQHWQHNVVAFRFCRPIWDRFIETAADADLLPGYAEDPALFHRVEWLPPKPDWVDPLKDVQADARAVAAGFKSRTQVIASLGYDPEQVDAEAAADQARARRLGLSIEGPADPLETTTDDD